MSNFVDPEDPWASRFGNVITNKGPFPLAAIEKRLDNLRKEKSGKSTGLDLDASTPDTQEEKDDR